MVEFSAWKMYSAAPCASIGLLLDQLIVSGESRMLLILVLKERCLYNQQI